MSTLISGSLGSVTSATSSTGVYVGHLNDCVVTLNYDYTGTFVDTNSAATIEISQDGTRWSATSASSACTYAAPSKSFALTGRCQFARVTATHCDYGTFSGHFSGRQTDQLPARFGTLGDISTTGVPAAVAAVDVSELDHIIVTSTGGSGNTTKVQTSYDGSDWVTAKTLVTSTDAVLIPLPCKLLRVNSSVYNAAEYVRFGGHKAPGKQRFGTLGDFSSGSTGTSVDVSDLDEVDLTIEYTDSGTFAAAMTILIEGSSDGTSWTTVPSGSISGSGSLAITSAYKLLRARCSSYTAGSATVRFGGINKDLVG
jgi:hypothetical protein